MTLRRKFKYFYFLWKLFSNRFVDTKGIWESQQTYLMSQTKHLMRTGILLAIKLFSVKYLAVPMPLHTLCVGQQPAATRWRACWAPEGPLHCAGVQGRGPAQDEHRPDGQCQEGLYWGGQGSGRPLCLHLICWTQGEQYNYPCNSIISTIMFRILFKYEHLYYLDIMLDYKLCKCMNISFSSIFPTSLLGCVY